MLLSLSIMSKMLYEHALLGEIQSMNPERTKVRSLVAGLP